MSAVRTVLGDIPAAELGVCDAHDHLFFASPVLAGQELDDPAAAERELRSFRELGGRAVIQWTPFGLRRRADVLAETARRGGVHLVAATGLHQAAHYPPELLARVRGRLAELFVGELTHGLRRDEDPDGPAGPVRAGMIKVAGAFHGVDEHARAVLIAAAEAHHATGAPIGVHLELGTAGPEVLELLCGDLEVPADRVILGHLNRSPDLRVQRALAEAGAFLAFDGPSRANHATDWRLFDELAALVAAGHADQILLGGDTTTAAARASTGGGPGMPFLLRSLRPRLEADLGPAVVTKFFVDNPARAFAAEWR
ncbi:phosphotriesterase family protein [Amycolatopsis anabasis]|uniref:phosphotriesterase family protein n=1 Tax=Amycolatopsis anabasis TaxID=1840409 RepID=UPI001FE335E9|nr:phosphotriesterase [Amycolatopsis anabasis]